MERLRIRVQRMKQIGVYVSNTCVVSIYFICIPTYDCTRAHVHERAALLQPARARSQVVSPIE